MQNSSKTLIKEIFTSIQGEGPEVGKKHIFVRFTRCNLSCSYCDTDFLSDAKEYSADELAEVLSKIDCDTISLTGGEPLLEVDFLENFFIEYKEKLNKRIYLETNGTLSAKLARIIGYIDTIAMDIKLKSATGQENRFIENDKFLNIASKKDAFIKVVFDENILDDEIKNVVNIAKKYNSRIILQPKMPFSPDLELEKIFEKFYLEYKNIRLIPQTHKFLNLN